MSERAGKNRRRGGKEDSRVTKVPKRAFRTTHFFDYQLLFYMVLLLAFGMVMLYSESSYTASLRYGDAAHWLKRQIFFTGLGSVALIIFCFFDYHKLLKISWIFYLGAILLCIYASVNGQSVNGQSRWIRIGSIQFQPSEFGKICVILFFAYLFVHAGEGLYRKWAVLKALLFLLPLVAIVAYTNLSTGVIIFFIWIVMLFVADKNLLPVFEIGIAGLVGGAFYVFFAGYRSDRVKIWRHPELYDKGYQTMQGLYAIGSGGIFGKGLGGGMQKRFVPEAQNDMIFSLICEELGIFGAVILIILFLLLLWRLFFIANHAADLEGSLIAIGVMAQIGIQVVLNIAVVTNSIPNTGVTLPFISYGGTALVILMAEIGIALNVSRSIDFYA